MMVDNLPFIILYVLQLCRLDLICFEFGALVLQQCVCIKMTGQLCTLE